MSGRTKKKTRHGYGRKPRYKDFREGLVDGLFRDQCDDNPTMADRDAGEGDRASSGPLSTRSKRPSLQISAAEARRLRSPIKCTNSNAGDIAAVARLALTLRRTSEPEDDRASTGPAVTDGGGSCRANHEAGGPNGAEDTSFGPLLGGHANLGDCRALGALSGDNKEISRKIENDPRDPDFAKLLWKRLGNAANSLFKFYDVDKIREAVAATCLRALEAAGRNEFHTISWWAKSLWGNEITRHRSTRHLLSLDGETSELIDGETARYWGAVQATQETTVLAHELLGNMKVLPFRHRLILRSRAEGATPLEISAEMHIPIGDVLHFLTQAREMIRSQIDEELFAP